MLKKMIKKITTKYSAKASKKSQKKKPMGLKKTLMMASRMSRK